MTGPFPPASRYADDSLLETPRIEVNQKDSCIKFRALLHASALCALLQLELAEVALLYSEIFAIGSSAIPREYHDPRKTAFESVFFSVGTSASSNNWKRTSFKTYSDSMWVSAG